MTYEQSPPEMAATIIDAMQEAVIGQSRMIERLVCSTIAGGHVLLEGVPGVGKTMTLRTLASVVGGDFARIQFTSDLLPSDIVGTRVYSSASESFRVEQGPIFANFVLADEINRAPSKVQSALLEVMEERQVTIAGTSMPVPNPFLVLATQNPIESEGVFPLPEAQRDRFMMRVLIDLPTLEEERLIATQYHSPTVPVTQQLNLEQLRALQSVAAAIDVPPPVIDYAVRLTMATRAPAENGISSLEGLIRSGASPRATLNITRAAKAMALIRGRASATAQDVYDVAFDVLNHRVLLSYDAIADGVDVLEVCDQILRKVPAPRGGR